MGNTKITLICLRCEASLNIDEKKRVIGNLKLDLPIYHSYCDRCFSEVENVNNDNYDSDFLVDSALDAEKEGFYEDE